MQNIRRYLLIYSFLTAFVLFAAQDVTAQLSGFSYRLKFQVNASQVEGTSDLTNFPVLVSLTDNDLRSVGNGGRVESANGYDIAFTAANGSTILSHQLESYNAATGAIEFWVRFPTLSASINTEFYIHFGNTSITTDQSNTNVWDSNYRMVLHLNNSYNDASGNGTNGINSGTVSAAGQIGNAVNFNSGGDLITVVDNGVSPLDISGNITISLWIRIANVGDGPDIITKGSFTDGYSVWVNGSGGLRFQINNDALQGPNGQITDNVWTYLAFTRASNGDRVIYRNGAEVASDNSSASFSVSDDDLFISTTAFEYLGRVDEVRISNNTRDSAWIATEYNNQNNPAGFFTQLNAEPVLNNIETGAFTYNSGDSPTTITSTITVADGDDTNIESAAISITGNFDSTEDVLAFTNQLGITGSYSSVTGVLTLTGSSSLANYQTALRAVTYQNTDPAPSELTRTVSFTINDGDDDSNTETRNINVVKVNNAPVLSNIESGSLIYFAGNGEKAITTTLEVSDIDDTNIDSARVEITSGYISAEDTLRFVDQNGIVGSWSETAGRLILTGSATLSTYQAALRSITYENESGSPTMTNRTISILVNDGTENSIAATRDIEYPSTITELASYKANDVFHFDAQDADGDGNSATNQPADGALTTWADRSDNVTTSVTDLSFTANAGTEEALLDASYFGDRGGLLFDGTDDYYERTTDDALLNLNPPFDEKSFAFVFRTGNDVTTLQVLYEQGGNTRGYIFGIESNLIYATRFDRNLTGTANDYSSISFGSVQPNTTYILIASHDATGSTDWDANLNGGAITTLTNAPTMEQHGGNAAIGNTDASTRHPDGSDATVATEAAPFDGFIAEMISWNSALSTTDFTNIYGFLSDKWFNTPPVVADIELSTITYNEADPAVTISSTVTITDADNTNLDSARVYIASGFDSSEDVLSGSGTGITSSYNSATGVLSLTGSSSVANYQAALRSVTYQNTDGISPSAATREINFIVYDWDDSSGVVTREIDIIPSNDAPTLANLEGTTLAFIENDGPTNITAAITISDTDDTDLEAATVSFTNNYFLGEDVLNYSDALGITGSFNSSTGVLTLSGTATLANYQTALRAVTYENISTDPVTGLDRTVEVRVYDGTDSSSVGTTRDISVASINTVPALANIESSKIFYVPGDSSLLSETITLTDPDDINIETIDIQISAGYLSAEDTLVFETIFGITSSWNDVSGTLTLTGPASKADFQSALRTVRYKNTATTPTDTDRTVSITANDGDGDSNTPTRTISFSIPKSVSNLLVWLKGDAGTFTTSAGTTPSTNGGNVGRWEDQSGNARHFSTTGTTPVFQTNVGSINSQNAVEFPGGAAVRLEDIDAENYLNGLDELTIFFVIESDGVATDRGFWTTYEPDATAEDRVFSIRYDDIGDNGSADDVITTGMRDLPVAFVQESFEDAQATTAQIVMLKWTSEVNYELYVDGVLSNPTFQQNIPTGILSGVTTAIIGQGTKDQTDSWDGLIAEVILYGKEVSISEQQDIEDYLSTKYDIAIRSLTAATGGEAISADSSNVTNGYIPLTGPRVQESFVGEYSNGGTFVFNAPTGFEWDITGTNPSASVTPAFGGTTELAVNFTSRTASQITFTVAAVSATNPGEITFSNFRVRPTTGTLPNTGNITNTGTTGLGGSTNYGALNMVAGTQIEMKYAQQPSTSNINAAITPPVRVQLIDQFGNSVEESRVNISVSLNTVSGSGTLGGTTTVETNVFGIAEFDNINVDATGTYNITASSTGLADTTSSNFDIVVIGQLTQFIVQRVPSGNIADKLAGQNFNITIVAADGLQDTVDTFTGTVSISSNCTMGTGQGTTANFVGGVLASKTVSISSLGTCSITATNSAGSEMGTSNTFDVTPGAATASTTAISASPSVILNDGFSTSTITVQLKDSEGNNRTVGGETVALSTTSGSLSPVTDNADGTYTATLTSSVIAGIATVTGTLDGTAITDNAEVEFAEFNNLWQSQVGSISDARNWDLAANWSSGSVPAPGDKILIPATPAVGNEQPVVNTTNTTVAQLSIEASASVTISGGKELIITGELSGDGEVLGSNTDSVTVGGDLDIDMTVGYVKLDGSSNQNVTTPNDYVNLELDNTNGADFSANLTVTDSLKLTNGTLFMPTGTNLIANSKLYGSGSIRMQRRIAGSRGWRLLSSPFNTTYGDFLDGTLTQGYTGSTLGNAPLDSLQPNVLTYLESFVGTDNQRFRAPGNITDPVVQGQGVFVFVFGDIAADSRYNDPLPDTLDVQGQEWNGDDTEVNFGITYTAAADTGWNLVGNPFLATIDWDDAANWTKTNVESTIYIWDPDANGGDGEYLTWNGVTGTLPTAGLIAPFQGFWVKANAPSPVLSVNKAAKTTGGGFLRKELPGSIEKKGKQQSTTDPQIQLRVTSPSGRSKKTNIMFSDEGANGKDNFDAFRLLPLSSSHIEFHTLLEDGTELAINSLPLEFNSRVFIPLHINYFEDGLPVSGELEMVWGGLRNIPEDWILTLIDNETGTEINVLEDLSYTFNHSTRAKIKTSGNPLRPTTSIRKKAASRSTRFTLKISTERIERDVPEEVFLDYNYPNPFNPETTIPFGIDRDMDVSLVIYDVLGRKVATLVNGRLTAGRYNQPFIASHLASGVYFYRLVTDTKVIDKKLTLIK